MENFLELAKKRYSVRAYKDAPIEEEKLELLLEAAKVAPSAKNCQPVVVYVVRSEEKRKALAGVCPCTWNAPVIFVITYRPDRASGGIRNENDCFGETDSAIVACHLMLEAADLGLGTCWVGMFRSEEVKKVLGLPEEVEVRHLMPAGYPADNAAPSPRHTQYRDRSEIVAFL